MQACQVCGKDNPAGVEYCEDCGAALSGGAGQAAGSAAPGASNPSASPPSASPPSPSPSDSSSAPAPSAGSASAGVSESGTPSATPVGSPASAGTGDGAASGATAPIPTASEPAPAPPQGGGGAGGGGSQRPRLAIKRYGSLTGEEIPLLGERLVVGRFDPETGPVDIDLSSASEAQHISRQHGELYREADGRWFVRDLGSTNGVFVKGEQAASFGPRITAPQPLSGGDELAFGNARFVFRTD
jgi:hypothetical protein